ncbi:SETMR methyltransferase, partial [Acromyrmex heyeri]
MEFTNTEIRAILKFSFVKGKSARETFREINGILGNGTLSLRTAEEWFRRFRAGENETMDKPAGGRPVTTNTDQIIENIELDRHVALCNYMDFILYNIFLYKIKVNIIIKI